LAGEDKCRRCGRCCRSLAVLPDGSLAHTGTPCPFLDTATNLCRVFKDRFWRNPHCLTTQEAMAGGLLPDDCPYVEDGNAGKT
jgi:uncharacterized cysteine cluster protein YcgN (CxxCxxCC family)